jgi:protease II
MANMSYCRFRNTFSDFLDCCANLYSLGKNDEKEIQARDNLIRYAADMLVELGVNIDPEEVNDAIANIGFEDDDFAEDEYPNWVPSINNR